MASDDKKTKTNPAPKNESPSERQERFRCRRSKAEGGKKADDSSSGYSGARARNRFQKLIRITGTRFSRRKRKDNGFAAYWR